MYHSDISIKEGALIISDAHFSTLRPVFLDFIISIQNSYIKTTQIIFMGDIFDALFGYIPQTYKNNQQIINIINNLSKSIEIVYLEGNHDFNLKDIFPNIKVFTISDQPIITTFKDKQVLLAHGDFDGTFSYKVYTKIIRNSFVLKFLNKVDMIFDNNILKNIDNHLMKKDDCKDFIGFKDFIKKRILKYKQFDYFIEGHFHQNKIFYFDDITYINLGVFACNQRYFRVEFVKDNELRLKEEQFVLGDIKNG